MKQLAIHHFMLSLAVHQYVLPVDIMIGAPVKQKESSYTMPEFVSRLNYH